MTMFCIVGKYNSCIPTVYGRSVVAMTGGLYEIVPWKEPASEAGYGSDKGTWSGTKAYVEGIPG